MATLLYIEIKSFGPNTLKMLIDTGSSISFIDTGSSISFIDPKHMNLDSTYLGSDEIITTAIGKFNANKKIDLPLFKEFNELPQKFQFCVRPFHKYFDGIIGLDLMEHLEAQPLICKPHKQFITRFSELPILEKPCLQSGKIPIEPLSRKVCLLPVDTDNGNVLIRETKISDDLTVPEGIYSVTNWVSAVEVANESNEPQIIHVEQPLRSEPLSNYNECNFHIETTNRTWTYPQFTNLSKLII